MAEDSGVYLGNISKLPHQDLQQRTSSERANIADKQVLVGILKTSAWEGSSGCGQVAVTARLAGKEPFAAGSPSSDTVFCFQNMKPSRVATARTLLCLSAWSSLLCVLVTPSRSPHDCSPKKAPWRWQLQPGTRGAQVLRFGTDLQPWMLTAIGQRRSVQGHGSFSCRVGWRS